MTRESAAARFARLNHSAAETFETLAKFIDGELIITSRETGRPVVFSIALPLTDSFVFTLWRAVRLANQARDELAAEGIDVDAYVKSLNSLDSIRNVTEHGHDQRNPRIGIKHEHDAGIIEIDDTSVGILGSTKVLRGGANLYELYCVARDCSDQLREKYLWKVTRYIPRT